MVAAQGFVAQSENGRKGMIDSVLTYASRGWFLHPLHWIKDNGNCSCGRNCPSPGKHPLTKKGYKDATCEESRLREWWSTWPEANIGLSSGPSGLTIVDLDGPEGQAELKDLVAKHGKIDQTLMCRTGREGGFHLYFNGGDLPSRKIGKHIDVRSSTGYVLLPPSNHASGRLYQWVSEKGGGFSEIADAPVWLKEHIAGGHNADKSGQKTDKNEENCKISKDRISEIKAVSPVLAKLAHLFQEDKEKVRSALAAISPDCSYEQWVAAGMALKDAFGDDGLALWDEWSSEAKVKAYPGYDELEKKWSSFGRGNKELRVTVGSIYHEAMKAGWTTEGWDAGGTASKTETVNDGNTKEKEEKASALPEDLASTTEITLEYLNERYCVIGDIGGRCLVMSWDPGEQTPSFQRPQVFKDRYSHHYHTVKAAGKGKDKKEQLGAYWFRWPGRRSYEGLKLVPRGPAILPGNVLNLWRGFAIEPKAGDWSLMNKHIDEVLAGGNQEAANYITRFAAWAIQHPGDRAGAALVFRGEEGVGKGTFGHAMRRIFGSHGVHVSNAKHMVGHFNAMLRNCVLLHADEAFWAGDKAGESVLKSMITEPVLMIEQKGVDPVQCHNMLHVIMTTNAAWAVPARHDARRYCVFDVSDTRKHDRAYWDALNQEMDNGGLAAMLYDLDAMELDGWHPRQIVKTEALQDQKELSMSWLDQWWEDVLQTGKLPFIIIIRKGEKAVVTNKVRGAVLYEQAKRHAQWLKPSQTAFGLYLRKTLTGLRSHDENGAVWVLPELGKCRSDWEKRFGEWKWDNLKEIIKWENDQNLGLVPIENKN
jgi:Bifunctional DNA primase/polymerase, N-terminal/Primase C terminal 2 (PriCT-2)/Family of unknown function (DUF5906)